MQDAGASGFTVQYTREVFRGDKRIRNERYTVRYDPQNSYVEEGPTEEARQAEEGKSPTQRQAPVRHRIPTRPAPDGSPDSPPSQAPSTPASPEGGGQPTPP